MSRLGKTLIRNTATNYIYLGTYLVFSYIHSPVPAARPGGKRLRILDFALGGIRLFTAAGFRVWKNRCKVRGRIPG